MTKFTASMPALAGATSTVTKGSVASCVVLRSFLFGLCCVLPLPFYSLASC